MLVLLLFIINVSFSSAEETKYILHDRCINILYKSAVSFFKDRGDIVLRDSRGIIIRFAISPDIEYMELSEPTKKSLSKIEYFLAKIKNPVIIEVHVAEFSKKTIMDLKKWEISAVIADNIVKTLCGADNSLNNRIHAVGYGEFLPENNTPNNGGKLLNRVDIIVLCNVIGE